MNKVKLDDLADYCKKHDIPDDARIVGKPGNLRHIVPVDVELPPWPVAELPVKVAECSIG